MQDFGRNQIGVQDSGFKLALAQRDVALKLFEYFIDVAFHHHVFPSRVWARGSMFKVQGSRLKGSGFGVQGSALPLAAASSLTEEETYKFR